MIWLALSAIGWTVLSVPVAILIGKGIALADRIEQP